MKTKSTMLLNSGETEQKKSEDQFWKIATDEKYFLRACCEVKDLQAGASVCFDFNLAQEDFYRRYWLPQFDVIMLKSRKWGFSTLMLGLGLHAALFTNGLIFRIVAHSTKTAIELNETVKKLYDSAFKFFNEIAKVDPYKYLPRKKYDDIKRYTFPERDSAVIVESGSSLAIGQSDRTDILYITEYSEWPKAETAYKGLIGSMPVGGINNRVIIDFNANGIGNDAYRKYQAAKRGENRFKAVFYGVNDCPDVYSPEEMERERIDLGDDFPAVYPSNDEEAFLVSPSQRFKTKYINQCGELEDGIYQAKYLIDIEPFKSQPELLAREIFSHGCDPAEGIETGSKTAISTRHVKTGMLACPPFNTFASPRETAFELRRRAELYPGIVVIERNNHGHAVIEKCQDLEMRSGIFKGQQFNNLLYREPDYDKQWSELKVGWLESADNKTLLASDYEEALKEQRINLPCEELRTQAREFCRRDNGTTGRPLQGERRGGKRISYDDLVIADMIALQGFEQARQVWQRRNRSNEQARSHAMAVGSMKKD